MTGRYRLVESIGQGGMGRVWRAADEMLDRQVAVKEMRIDGLDAEDTRTRRERTLREARATARIDHPNVVRVYDVVDEGERLWIVMELVKGRSLERMMVEDGALDPRATALLGLGLVEALRQVHARGVLHRDIKPGNVLVESGSRTGRRIVLTDFGIAAMQDAKALTMVGMLVGSPDYMAPERVSGRPQGPPSDIWSLGATLCAALGGRSPFSRDTTLATLHAVLYEEPELPAAAVPLTDILAALLEKDPSIRPGLDEVEAALHVVAFPAPTPTMRVGPLEDPGTPEVPGAAGAPGTPDAPDTGVAPVPPDGPPPAGPQPEGTPSPWAPRESPTPAYLEPGVVRAARDPRVPAPTTGAEPVVRESPGGPGQAEPSDAVPLAFLGAAGEGALDAPPGTGARPETDAETPPPAEAAPRSATEPTEPSRRFGGAERSESAERPSPAEPHTANEHPTTTEPPTPSEPLGSAGRSAVPELSRLPEQSSVEPPASAEPPAPAEPFATGVSAGVSTAVSVGGDPVSVSSEALSEEGSEVRSEASAGNSLGAVLRAGATTASTPLASAPTQDSLSAGVPTEHYPMPDAPTRDTPTRVASAPTRVGPRPGVSLIRGNPAEPDTDAGRAGGSGSPSPSAPDPDPDTHPLPGRDPALVLGPHPHRVPPEEPPDEAELPGPARPAAPSHRTRRRTALVAAGGVLTATAVVVGIVLATTSGAPGDDQAGGSSSASSSASASVSETGASTPTGTPSPTVEGTSRPRSLPPGAHEEAGGFAWATPTGWRRDVKTGAEVHYTSPDGKQELAAKSSLARGDLMETWETSEQNAHQGQDYRKIRLEETTFRDHPAVVWEYTFTLGGIPWHAQLLGFNEGDKSYQINTWYQPDIEQKALDTYEKVKDSFTVL
ncbi:Serine/threonine-protein kinase PrkC [Streptomyces griseorubiginosus]|uniref:non-specific serine/threonine protein kinase n=2 Tax=Streptomyces griseorubiginosus TaxID=67304 RepID=A0AAI8L4N5_9ACTN|nr:serine/threonine-protein kinase [Streptomyces griseorubiginosus]AYC41231.1 Serine/threonine-protein kinase PrkC [Streptomyces griseorubiginosus]